MLKSGLDSHVSEEPRKGRLLIPTPTAASCLVLPVKSHSCLVCLLWQVQIRIFNYLRRMFYGLTVKCFETINYLISANEMLQRRQILLVIYHVFFHVPVHPP